MSTANPETPVKKESHDEWMATHLNYYRGTKRGSNKVSDPKKIHDRLDQLFQAANKRLLLACQRLGEMQGKPSETAIHFPKANDVAFGVTRYLSGLNYNKELTGKEAESYLATLKKAEENLEKFWELVKEAEKKVLETASSDIEKQKEIVSESTKTVQSVKDEMNALKVPAVTETKNRMVTVVFKETKVDANSIKFAEQTRLPFLRTVKPQTKPVKDEIAFLERVLQQKPKFEELAEKLKVAEASKNTAEEVLSKKRSDEFKFEKERDKPKEDYTNKKLALEKTINLLVASGECFGEDHSGFLKSLEEIHLKSTSNNSYEIGFTALETLELAVNAAASKLQNEVIKQAGISNQKLNLVKDPLGLDEVPSLKKSVDIARANIAKPLRDPLIGTEVYKANLAIADFEKLVKQAEEQLDQRPEQVLSCAKKTFLYGEKLEVIGAKSTGDGKISYKNDADQLLAPEALLDAGSKNLVVLAGGTEKFKSASLPVTITIDKNTPSILWEEPLPVLRNNRLTDKTLNATIQNSFKKLVPLNPVYTPALNTLMSNVGMQPLRANFAGNSNYSAAAEKQVTVKVIGTATELGKEAMMSGRSWKGPTSTKDKELLEKWNKDDSGLKTQAQEVMKDIQGMTGDELIAYMDELECEYTPDDPHKVFPSNIWHFPNGLQVRYKPNGDGRPPQTIPPTPMFCIEAKTSDGPSGGKSDVAFKVTSEGNPAAYGPDETLLPDGIPSNSGSQLYKNYMDAACGTTHLKCKPKVEQTITWANPPDIILGQPLGEASLMPTAQDSTALEFTRADTGEVINKDTVLPAGILKLRVKGKETLRYKASSAFVEVDLRVNLKPQVIVWNSVKEILAGSKLGKAVLNATAEDNATLSYFDAENKPIDENTILPAGKGIILKVRSAATASYAAVNEPAVTVTIDVNKQQQEIVWDNPKDISVDEPLTEEHLAAKVKDNAKCIYRNAKGEIIQVGDTLPAGLAQALTVEALATDLYEASLSPLAVKINVKKLTQALTWSPPLELSSGTALGDSVMNAKSSSGVEPVYYDAGRIGLEKTTVLPVGEHQVTAIAPSTDRFEESEPISHTITVKQAEDTL
jgi:hypothetical protein